MSSRKRTSKCKRGAEYWSKLPMSGTGISHNAGVNKLTKRITHSIVRMKHEDAIRRELAELDEQMAELNKETAFYKSKKARTWDCFGDTIFPEFEKPETWCPSNYDLDKYDTHLSELEEEQQ